MEVEEGNKVAFNNKLKNNFSKIYTSESVTSKDVVKNIETVINS